jgi:WD40 repeat protein
MDRQPAVRALAAGCAVLAVALVVVGALSIRDHGRSGPDREVALAGDGELATARGLAFASQATLGSSPELALALALEACRRACDHPPEKIYEVRHSLLTALQRRARLQNAFPLPGEPQGLAVSSNGLIAVTTDDDRRRGSLVVFDLASGESRARRLDTNLYRSITFTPDGRRLVAADTQEGYVDTFDMRTLKTTGRRVRVAPVYVYQGRRGEDDLGSVDLSPDGRLALVYGTHDTFNVWDLSRGAPLDGFPASSGFADSEEEGEGLSAEFSPDGRMIATFGARTTFWDVERGHAIGSIPGRGAPFAFTQTARRAAVATRRGIQLWHIADTPRQGRLLPLPRAVGSIEFDGSGTRIAASAGDGVWIWKLGSRPSRPKRVRISGTVSFAPRGDALVVVANNEEPVLVDGGRGKRAPAPIGGERGALIAFTHDGRSLVSATNGIVRVWDASGRHPLVDGVVNPEGTPYLIEALAWSPDGSLLAAGGFDGAVRVGRAVPGGELAQISPAVENPVGAVQFSPDGTKLASLAFLHPIVLWDVQDDEPYARRVGDVSGEFDGLAFADGGRTLAALDDVNALARFWDLELKRWETRTYLLIPAGATPTFPHFTGFALSPDGKIVATGDLYGYVYLARVDGNRLGDRVVLFRPETGAGSAIKSLGFSGDGSVLVSATEHGTVRLWDVRRRIPLGEPFSADGAAALAADEARLASASTRDEIALWDEVLLSTDFEEWKRRVCPVIRHTFTRAQWAQFLPGEEYDPACGD